MLFWIHLRMLRLLQARSSASVAFSSYIALWRSKFTRIAIQISGSHPRANVYRLNPSSENCERYTREKRNCKSALSCAFQECVLSIRSRSIAFSLDTHKDAVKKDWKRRQTAQRKNGASQSFLLLFLFLRAYTKLLSRCLCERRLARFLPSRMALRDGEWNIAPSSELLPYYPEQGSPNLMANGPD